LNRNAYIAELTQLLYYMTPWDREAAVKKYKRMFDEAEDVDALIREIGKPMKLAVTLSRSYEPTPEPDPNAAEASQETPTEAEEAQTDTIPEETAEEPVADSTNTDSEAPEEAVLTQQPDEEPEPEAQESVSEPSQPVEEGSQEEIADSSESEEPKTQAEQAEQAGPETDPAEQAEPCPPEEPAVQEDAPDAAPVSEKAEPPAQEEIFSEIFTAATKAQSAIFPSVELKEAPAVRKPRMGFLIPYIIAAVIIDIPVSIILFAVDIAIFGIAILALVFGVYVLHFLGVPQFGGVGDKLVIMGVCILAVTAALAVAALGVWFLRNAAIGFTEFLVRFGKKHGYQEEGTP